MLEKNDSSSDLVTSAPAEIAKPVKLSPKRHSLSGWPTLVFRGVAQLVLMAIILGGAYVAMDRLIDSKPKIAQRPIFPTVYTVETKIAESGTHQPILALYGEVVAGRSVDLRSLVSGEVVSINEKLKAGGTVEKGEALVEVDIFNYQGALREARANEAETKARIDENLARLRSERSRLASNREQLELAKNDLNRINDLRSRGTATAKQVEDRSLVVSQRAQSVEQSEINIITENAKLAQLEATLERLAWKIEQAERNLTDTVLVAPFNGTIRSNQVEIGKVVGSNDVVVSMYQTDKLEARFVLTDERFGRLQADEAGLIGRPIEVIWFVGGKEYAFRARIDRIGAEIASSRGGIEIYATIENSDSGIILRPGAFIDVRVPDRAFKNHMRLPDTSIYNGDTVYIVQQKKLVARKVEISAYDGEDAIIGSGVVPGDEVLTTRISEVSEGLRVRKEGDPIIRRGKQGQGQRQRRNGSHG